MKLFIALCIAVTFAACDKVERLGSATMSLARNHTDYKAGCPSHKRWMECDGSRTPAEAAGGGD